MQKPKDVKEEKWQKFIASTDLEYLKKQAVVDALSRQVVTAVCDASYELDKVAGHTLAEFHQRIGMAESFLSFARTCYWEYSEAAEGLRKYVKD